MLFDDLAYFSRFSSDRQVVPLPVVFHDLEIDAGVRRFQSVVVIPFEPIAPPVFRRGVCWNAGGMLSSAAYRVRMRPLGISLLVLLMQIIQGTF